MGFSGPESTSSLFTVVVDGPTQVAVGEQVVVEVTLTNVGAGEANLAHSGGVAPAQPPNTVALVSRPPVASTPVPRAGTYVGTWVYDSLRDGTIRFDLGGRSIVTGCQGCTNTYTVEHEVVIGSGISATTTATPGGGPTATPTPAPTATIPALGDPAEAKRAVKCQRAVAKARAGAQSAGLKGFDACAGKVSKCVQTNPGGSACLDKAAAGCTRVRDKLAVTDGKLAAAIRKACGELAPEHLFGPDGLGADGIGARCVAHGVAPAASLEGLIACQLAVTACTVADVTEAEQPRVVVLLELVGSDLGARSACLDGLGGPGGVGDAKLGKSVEACRTAIATGLQTFIAAHAKSTASCATAALKCVQEKPGDAACMTKASATCAKISPAHDAGAAKLGDAITKKCAAVDFGTLTGATGLALGSLTARCANVGVPSIATLNQYLACLVRIAACRADDATSIAIPRIGELLAATNQSLVCE